MQPATAALLLAIWLLVIGLATVYVEVESVRAGSRIRGLLKEEESRVEHVRELELRYNQLVSPDWLEKQLPEDFLVPGFGAEPEPEPTDGDLTLTESISL